MHLFCALLLSFAVVQAYPTCTSNINKTVNSIYDSHIAHTQEGRHVQTLCESKQSVNNAEAELVMSMVGGQLNVQPTTIEHHQNYTAFKRIAHLKIPSNNYGAYMFNALKVTCTVNGLSCFVQLQVEFAPFVDWTVPRVQSLERGSSGTIECPIRAPNFPPYQYQLLWTSKNSNGVKNEHFTRNFTLTSFFFPIAKATIDYHDSVFTCTLLRNNSVRLNSSVRVVHFTPRKTRTMQPLFLLL
jgi:hypothetical protein